MGRANVFITSEKSQWVDQRKEERGELLSRANKACIIHHDISAFCTTTAAVDCT